MGRCLPWSRVSDGDILIAIKVYLDKSGDKGDEFLTLSAIAAEETLWADVEPKWKAMVKNREPQADYIHMKEMVGLYAGFDREKGWTHEKVDKLLRDALYLIRDMKKKDYCAFSCILDLSAYRRLRKEKKISVQYVDICNDLVCKKALHWHVERRKESLVIEKKTDDDLIHYFFDRNEPFEGALKNRWNRNWRMAHHRGDINYWSLVKHIGSSNMRDVPALQIADMLAWSLKRAYESDERFIHMADMMRQFIPHYIYEIGEEKLLKHFSDSASS